MNTPNADSVRLHCNRCGQACSTPVPRGTVVRGWIECADCLNRDYEESAPIEGSGYTVEGSVKDDPGANRFRQEADGL